MKFVIEVDLEAQNMDNVGAVLAYAQTMLTQLKSQLPLEKDFKGLLQNENPAILGEACAPGERTRCEARGVVTMAEFDRKLYSLERAAQPGVSLSQKTVTFSTK